MYQRRHNSFIAAAGGRPDESFYLLQLARSSGAGLGTVQLELAILAEAGVIQRRRIGRQVFFKANPEWPIFAELKGIVTKTFGIADILRAALGALSEQVLVAFQGGESDGFPSRRVQEETRREEPFPGRRDERTEDIHRGD